MYKIALCDDESGMRFQIAEHLREYYENIFEINEYADGEDLLTDICNEKYFDIIFLDIRMGEKNGVAVAKEIRKNTVCLDAILIFITSYNFDISEIVEVRPFAYIYKENLARDMKRRIDSALTQLEDNQMISFGYERNKMRIAKKNIQYVESKRGAIIIHTQEKEYQSWSYNLNQLEEAVSSTFFRRCHQSYLVNMLHVKSISRNEIIMNDGTHIPVSRKYIKEVLL